LIKTFQVIHNS